MRLSQNWRKWYRDLRRLGRQLADYEIYTYAASASFFIITSLFPMLVLVFSIVSYIPLAEETVLVKGILRLLPDALLPVFLPIIQELQQSNLAGLSISIVAILWTSSRSMMGVLAGLNNIAGVRDTRNFLFKRMICSGFMLLLVLMMVATLVLWGFGHTILTFFRKYLPYLGLVFETILEFRGAALFAAISLTLAVLYTLFPHRKMNFVMQIPGAVFVSCAWLIFSNLYSKYVEYALATSVIYGSLGMIVMAMLWIYFCMMILFFGALLNRFCEKLVKGKSAVG